MGKRTVVTADRLLTPLAVVERPVLVMEEGVVTALGPREGASEPASTGPGGATLEDFPGCTLVPSFLDIHIHGSAGHDVMEGSSAALDGIGVFLARRGVGAYLPTTVTAPVETLLKSLDSIADSIEAGLGAKENADAATATPIGIHLEGPFVSHAKRGVHPVEHIQKPTVELLERFWQAARGHIRLMTIAPEVAGALAVTARATELGIRVSLGHSNATAAETRAAIGAGAVSATHTFNAMRPLHHREPGILGVVLDDQDLFAEYICDGIHSAPSIARLFMRAKGGGRGILITDAISATGMPDGSYQLGDLLVEVKGDTCLNQGSLAGSVLTMDKAVRNFRRFTNTTETVTYRMATSNPAQMLGLSESHGQIAVGRRADIAVVGKDGELRQVFLGGRRVMGSSPSR